MTGEDAPGPAEPALEPPPGRHGPDIPGPRPALSAPDDVFEAKVLRSFFQDEERAGGGSTEA